MKKVLRLLTLGTFAMFTANISSAQIVSFPYTQDFEAFATCGTSCGASCVLSENWSNAAGDNLDWITDLGGTTSSSTGPTANGGADHNPGTSSGKYLYVETSCSGTGFPSMEANLLSPSIDLTGTNDVQFEFWYHMYGQTMGTLHIDVSNDAGATWVTDVVPAWTDNQDIWQQASVSLGLWSGQTVIVRLRFISGSNYYSDVAIDDVLIYDLLSEDAGITAFTAPLLPTCSFNDTVEVELTNFGTDTLTSVDIDWLWDAAPQPQVNWTGSVPPGMTTTVFLGTVAYTNGSVLIAQTSNPNGVAEQPSGAGNDATLITVSTGLNGVYSIDGSGSGDYLTFTDAVSDLSTFGVCGPVVFNVADGIYAEQITLNEITGMDATNTVTFQGASADPALAVLEYSGTATGDNFTVLMDGGDYYIFNDLTLSNQGATYGRVIQTTNGATNNMWMGNIITGAPSTTTSNNKALVFSGSGSSIDSMNVFDGNSFVNGSYGFYWYGNGTADLESGTVLQNNTFTDFYYRGIHMYYQNDMTIANNVFTPGTSYTGSIYRVYMVYADGVLRVYDNEIQTNKYGYGIYMSNCDATSANRGYVYNNFVHVGDTNSTSTSYGIYMTACNNQVIAHNSVNVESNGTSSRAIYVTGGNQNHVKNNIFQTMGPGYGMYYNSGVVASDNNDIYVPNGNPFYSGGAIATLDAWQSATSFDMASDTLDPMFASSDDLHTCEDLAIDAGGMPDTLVITDIDGQTRSTTTPDIGADEFIGLANLSFSADTIWKCSSDAITLGGWEPTDGATYLWSTTETTPSVSVSAAGPVTVLVNTACGSTTVGTEVMNIPDAVASFTMVSAFMTAAFTNTSTGTIDTYLWDFGDGTTSTSMNPTHLYADTGSYTVTLTVTGPCGTDVFTSTMNSTVVGVDDLAIFNSLEVYPNPNKGEFAIDFDLEEAAEVSFELTSMQGRTVWTSSLGTINGSHSESVELSNQASGIYFLNVTVGEHTTVRKIVVE